MHGAHACACRLPTLCDMHIMQEHSLFIEVDPAFWQMVKFEFAVTLTAGGNPRFFLPSADVAELCGGLLLLSRRSSAPRL